MMRALPPLDAYRADLVGAGHGEAFSDHDGQWLLAAELLVRLAETGGRGEAAARLVRDLDALVFPARGDEWDGGRRESRSADALLARLRSVAEDMEELGALRLAYCTLTAAERGLPDASGRGRGLAIAQRARVGRKLGDFETAASLYRATARLGRRLRDAELIARAWVGRGMLARIRGNYPEARDHFRRALALAEHARLDDLMSLAHQGLFVTAAVAEDFDTALRHGWKAFQLSANDRVRRAELLANLAGVSRSAGYHAAALRGYLAAISLSTSSRLRLPALGGAAVAAARLGDIASLDAITSELERELARQDLPYERAQALTLLTEAWAACSPAAKGEPYASRVLALATVHGFHELAYEVRMAVQAARDACARLEHARLTSPEPLAPASHAIVRQLEALPLLAVGAPAEGTAAD